MQNFNVKITGTGTRAEIVASLNALIQTVTDFPIDIEATFEDETLIMDISVAEPETE